MFFALYCMLFGILVFFPETDAGELTWKEPLPIQTVPDNNITDHFGKKDLFEGSINATLRWHFALTGLTFDSLTILFGGQGIAGARPSAQAPVPGYENKYGINWVASQNLVTLFIFNVTTEVDGIFTCRVDTDKGILSFPFSSIIEVNVVDPPSNITSSSDQTITAPAVLTLNCSADGKPKPTITWTRVSDNTVVYMPLTITGGKNEESYLCTAGNGVGQNLTKVVRVTILSPPSNIMASSDQTITAPAELTLNCSANGNPKPTITWKRVSDSTVVYMPLNITGGKNEESYRCTADNGVGKKLTKVVNITILYKPDTVSLVVTTTENTNCSDLLWANLTCETSVANPPVECYQLLKNGAIWATSDNGTWIREIVEAGKHVYSCRALHFLGNVTSSDKTVTFHVLGQISVFASGSVVLVEGDNVFLHCDAFAYPKPTVSWSKSSGDDFIVVVSSWLNFTNIRRDVAGDYVCIANNTCGTRNSSRRNIDVQYKPDHVSLNIPTKVCAGTAVMVTCLAGAANPSVRNYTLYKFVTGLANSSSNQVGVFKETLLIEGLHNYICEASNSVGSTSSHNRTVEVQVTGSIKIANGSVQVLEGASASVHCNFSGFHSHLVSWVNASNYIVEAGNILKFPNISRHDRGEYSCSASNVCGGDSKRVFVDVQYPVEATRKGRNYCVLEGESEILTCPVAGNPKPNITWYNSSGASISIEKELETGESGCYVCVANNSIGTSINITMCLIVRRGTCSTTTTSATVPDRTQIPGQLTIGANYIEEYKDLNSSSSIIFVTEFVEEMNRRCMHFPWYIGTEVTNLSFSRGSVTVEFILYIKTAKTEENRVEKLKAAISANGTFGRYKAGDLALLSDESTTSTTPGSPKPTVSAGSPWAIIAAVTGGVVLLAILVGVSTWWVHKQRKCRKDTKIHSDVGRHDDEAGYSEVKGAYAQSGPPAANGTDGSAGQQIEVAAAAIPTYAVVDKSKKDKKQADEKPPEYAVVDKSKKEKQEAATIPTYAAVDKSKKKKKSCEEVPAVYAEVEKSKKKKKKTNDKNPYENFDETKKEKKPGELLYADLGDFQNPGMPTVCISPQPLPAIKKADPYERTDYADITQFLKGNATLPPNDGNGDTEMKPKRPSKRNVQGNDKETPI